jgi:membrane-associated phospholipid phosphatase
MRKLPLLVALPAAAAFVAVARAVANGSARRIDEHVRHRVLTRRAPALDAASAIVTPLTAPPLLIAASLALAFAVRRRGAHVALPIAAAPFAAMIAGRTFTELLPQQDSPSECEPCFPSGHTTGATAEAFTIAYVLRREKMIGVPLAMTIAAMPFIGGANRLYRDRHWSSDIVAGWAAGTVIAALMAF